MSTPYCVVGCTRGTGLQIVRQLAARGAPVRCIARDPAKARSLLPSGGDIRAGDVTVAPRPTGGVQRESKRNPDDEKGDTE